MLSIDAQPPIETLLQEALQATIHKASSAGIRLYLTGGVAAFVHAGKAVRPLSFDLDFMIEQHSQQAVSTAFDAVFIRHTAKPTFQSLKATTSAENDCDLDFIVDQQITPDPTDPECTLTTSLDQDLIGFCGQGKFEGIDINLAPSEYVFLTKVFAGRDISLGKYDLLDARAIIHNAAKNHFNTSRLFEMINKFLANAAPPQKTKVISRLTANVTKLKNEKSSEPSLAIINAVLQSLADLK